MGHFWQGARRAWVAFHEMAAVCGSLEAAEALARLARLRADRMKHFLACWLDDLRALGCFVTPNAEEVRA